jgi:adenylylsulfate kinase
MKMSGEQTDVPHTKNEQVVSNNITWSKGKVTAAERSRLMRHDAATIWLTGLSGAGKSTIAYELEKRMFEHGHIVYALDGDNMRHGLNRDLGFTHADRTENIRRIAEVAKLFNNAGIFVVAAFISPYKADRAMACEIIGTDNFIETYLAAGLDVCEQRDPKGLYKKARAGTICDFTGVSAPYEAPENPALIIDTGRLSVGDSITEIMRTVSKRFREA